MRAPVSRFSRSETAPTDIVFTGYWISLAVAISAETYWECLRTADCFGGNTKAAKKIATLAAAK